MGPSFGGQRFNSDLLVSDDDVAAARVAYPAAWPLLVNERLLQEFGKADEVANEAKRLTTRVGLIAIALCLLGLAIAAFARVIDDLGDAASTALTVLGIAFGLLGPFIGIKASGNGGPALRWLHARFVTERMRQFHFQSVLKIVCEADDDTQPSTTSLASKIAPRLAELRQRFRIGLAAEFDIFVDAVTGPRAYRLFRIDCTNAAGKPTANLYTELLDAYRELRIGRQLTYCGHVLRRARGLFDFPLRKQNAWLTTLGPACIILMLVLHLTHGLAFAKGAHLGPYLDAAVLFFALLALAGRALESGLSPDDEIERYEIYQRRCAAARDAFDAATTLDQKVEAMNEMEFAAAEELQEFLRVKSKARFVM